MELSVRIDHQDHARPAARELLAKVNPEEWALAVAFALEVVALSEAVDQAAEVWFEVRRRE